MTFTLTPDPVAFGDNLITLIADAVNQYATSISQTNWLPASSIKQTTPPVPYAEELPTPFAVLRNPTHSTSSDGETYSTGNIPGAPNVYRLILYETAYVASTVRTMEELRLKNTYAAIATVLVPPGGNGGVCVPDFAAVVVSVKKVEDPNGPFVVLGENEVWLGLYIDIAIVEQYA